MAVVDDMDTRAQLGLGRVIGIDIARSVALAGMILFHLVFDLALYGYLPADAARTGGWPLFAKMVAGSFLFIAGLSLFLAWTDGLRPGRFLRRLAMIVAAALGVTVATYLMMPGAYVYFGILHAIATFSVLGLAVLRLPVALVTLAGAVAFMLPWVFRQAGLYIDWPVSLGLARSHPPSMDFEPVFPWIAPFLFGIALGQIGHRRGIWRRWRVPRDREPAVLSWLAWPGRHSLAVYLLHQPVLIGVLEAVKRVSEAV